MDTQEYQAKQILQHYGIPVSAFSVVSSVSEIENVVDSMGLTKGVVKAQVHAGGRGKAGGVKLANTQEEIIAFAKQLLGFRIVNNQTGKEGLIAHKVLISPMTDIAKEYYIGATIDRENATSSLMVSKEGGVDIEEVAKKKPDKILKLKIGLDGTIRNYRLVALTKFLGVQGEKARQLTDLAKNLAKAFVERDASLLEINPLVETKSGTFLALDAKLTIDDNALFRQKEIAEFYDPTQLQPNEREAHEIGLAYVALDGDIGCMVNGAGLAMATMDMIYLKGGRPANFLDVGGGASKEKVAKGFKILLADPKIKAILVNIFGGIMSCETIAEGIINAASKYVIEVPLVVRMEGTHVDLGRQKLGRSGLNILVAKNLSEAAEQAVFASKT